MMTIRIFAVIWIWVHAASAQEVLTMADVDVLMKTCQSAESTSVKDFKSKFTAAAVKAEKFISKTDEQAFFEQLKKDDSLHLFFAYTWPVQFKLRGWNWGGIYKRTGAAHQQLREAVFANKSVTEKKDLLRVWRNSMIKDYHDESHLPPMAKTLLKCYENLANK